MIQNTNSTQTAIKQTQTLITRLSAQLDGKVFDIMYSPCEATAWEYAERDDWRIGWERTMQDEEVLSQCEFDENSLIELGVTEGSLITLDLNNALDGFPDTDKLLILTKTAERMQLLLESGELDGDYGEMSLVENSR